MWGSPTRTWPGMYWSRSIHLQHLSNAKKITYNLKNVLMQHSYLLAGISSGKLFRLLSRNRISLHPKYLLRVLFLLQGSFFASVFNRVEKWKLGSKLKTYNMPDDPVFIIGHWRTGTTLLHQLMALNDKLVTPSVFHVSTPESFLISGWSAR